MSYRYPFDWISSCMYSVWCMVSQQVAVPRPTYILVLSMAARVARPALALPPCKWPLPRCAPTALRAALDSDERALCALPVDANCVATLSGPVEFYQYLLRATASSQRRIVLASLYIGSGAMETSLLEAVAAACKRRPALRATLLVDALRAQRVEKPTKISRCASAPKP